MNLFKIRDFQPLMKFLKTEIYQTITNKVEETNLTKTEISLVCNEKTNQQLKTEMEARILSFLFLFMDVEKTDIGAGDIASSKFRTDLHPGEYSYTKTHTLLTSIFNEMVNGSMPGSIFETPKFFSNLDDYTNDQFKSNKNHESIVWNMQSKLGLLNIPYETLHNYHLLWYTYNFIEDRKFVLFCQYVDNCSDAHSYIFPMSIQQNNLLNSVRKFLKFDKYVVYTWIIILENEIWGNFRFRQ